MQEIKNQKESKFDYSLLDDEVASYLQDRVKTMHKIVSDNATQIGKQLYLSQKKLADFNNEGLFGKWLESTGFSRSSAYNYINRYNAVQRLDSEDEIKQFESLPKNLTYDISKPSAPQEAVDAVMNGDITTHKEYKELERKLKMVQEENRDKDLQIERLNNQPKLEPKVIEKEVEVEKVPDDYQQLKQQVQTIGSLRDRNNELQGQIDDLNSKLSEMNAKGQEYEELQEKIDKLEKQRSNVRQSIDAGSNIMLLNDQLKELFDTKLSALRYKNFFADDPMTSTVKETEDLLDTLQGFIDDMRHILPKQDRKIIEGKFSE